MDELHHGDVPYGNDWDSAREAAEWTAQADRTRPWRVGIRDHIARRIAALPAGIRVLELGAGPGFLAHRVLETCPNVTAYTLLDFSAPMLELGRSRLARFPSASFVLASFKADDWPEHVATPVDCVLSMQAVHELRNKQHAARLYEQVHRTLAVPGLVLICDHTPFDDTPKSTTLYMSEQEHQQALAKAGFTGVRIELQIDSLVLYGAERTR
jgi:SAM-dependent methyltransferase